MCLVDVKCYTKEWSNKDVPVIVIQEVYVIYNPKDRTFDCEFNRIEPLEIFKIIIFLRQ